MAWGSRSGFALNVQLRDAGAALQAEPKTGHDGYAFVCVSMELARAWSDARRMQHHDIGGSARLIVDERSTRQTYPDDGGLRTWAR